MNDGELKYPQWQNALQEALLEFDPAKLPKKVQEVESLIFDRAQELSRDGDGRSELEAINDALSTLRALKRDKLGFPDWK